MSSTHTTTIYREHIVLRTVENNVPASDCVDASSISHRLNLHRPIPNSYWATPTLLACEYPFNPLATRPQLDAILIAGVRTFIDLTEPVEPLLPYLPHIAERAEAVGLPPSETLDIEYHRFPIPDRQLPASTAYMARILEVLADCQARGRKAAVHCRGGIGRTGMVIGCWLVQSGVARDGADALRIIAEEWKTVEKCRRFPHSPETGPQFEFVQNFQRVREIQADMSVMTA